MALVRPRIDIDWKAPRASSDDEKRRGTSYPTRRFGGLRGELEQRRGERGPAAVADDGANRRVTRAAAKAAARGPDARSDAANVFNFSQEDEEGEDAGRKYSPCSSGKKNYGVLPIIKRKRHGHVGPRTIPVDKMYSSQPFSKSGNQQRAHSIDPEESDHGKCQQSESFSFSRFSKRRKEQLQDSSSVYSRKVQDVVLLDDEDMQTEGEVNYEISDIRNEPKIYYPSRDDPEAVELTSSDISCLDPGAFLSSPVINYYIQNIKRTRLNREDCRDKFYIFNTYFYGKLEEALYQLGDLSKLRRWWKGVNIFHRAYVILPIHGAVHWSLVIICMPAKESVSGPIILHLDSLGMHHSTKILNTVGRYLEEEWQHLKKNTSPETSVSEIICEDLPSNIHKEKVQVPQQNNAYDCGIFMLYYIEQFIREAPESWFKPEDASGLRLRIRELLQEAFESACHVLQYIQQTSKSAGCAARRRTRDARSRSTSRGSYELRSRGPASQGFNALDNLVSRSRRSSPTRPPSSSVAAGPSSPGSATSCATPAIGDDLKATVEDLTKAVQALQATAEANARAIQALSTDQPSSAGHPPSSGEHCYII
ncbi:ubiquitin-like-specific protease 1D isoform X2 [Panicum hallii]|uniref:ubiquitin-like-specific protease 1D isoform X2 n=1 Tax=Panicum hallii TaxID=206008 RepID=UPI000DF4EB25|nr:ubiquitin-like-specific protease 1D isoform X2 [Panicum hallii]